MNSRGSKFRFHCPACGQALNAPAGSVGKRAVCPHCKVSITIPKGLERPIAEDDPATTLALPAKTSTEPPAWREIVRNCRDFVPLIECAAGVGSGLLISRDGLVLTSKHVVAHATLFMLKFHDGSRAKAVIVHQHGTRDLAILRAAIARDCCFDIDKEVADAVEAGDDVLAIGHPRGLAFTSTRGIVSEPHRLLIDGEYVQTDVAINPGNSGGPLVDRFGKLVGVNTQIQRDSEGLGFAIGGKEARAYAMFVIDQLARKQLHFPTDEEIAAAERAMTPWDIANAAAKASSLAYAPGKLPSGEPCIELQSPGGTRFVVYIGGNLYVVGGCMANQLTEKQIRDPVLLLQLIRWQNELCGPAFDIAQHSLFIGLRRRVEGLDVNEARDAILRVAEALDRLSTPIRQILGR